MAQVGNPLPNILGSRPLFLHHNLDEEFLYYRVPNRLPGMCLFDCWYN
jgi:hypothetical protein